jgi:ATPase subunit of ABC transporter with duplicated ATPase domains
LLYRALARGARLLFLDEPMNHLDAGTRSLLWSALERYVASGGAVVLVCHDGGTAPDLAVPHARLVLGEPGPLSAARGVTTGATVGEEAQ